MGRRRVAVALMIVTSLVACGSAERESKSAEEQEFREQMLEEQRQEDELLEKEREASDRYEAKVERLDRIADEAMDKANWSRDETDLRRAELAAARAYIYRDFEFDSSGYECPPEAPIKGNEPWGSSALIYHKVGWIYYGATIPEWCFKTEKQARKYGFRPSKIRR